MKNAAILLPLMFAGCAPTINAPSLAPRPIEATRPDDIARPPAPALPDATMVEAARELLARARAADAAFQREVTGIVGTGLRGSEAWVIAQTKRSSAEIARGPVLDALRAIDTLIARSIDQGRDSAMLVETRQQLESIASRQDQVLAGISE